MRLSYPEFGRIHRFSRDSDAFWNNSPSSPHSHSRLRRILDHNLRNTPVVEWSSRAPSASNCLDVLRLQRRALLPRVSAHARNGRTVGTAPPDAGLAAICTRRAGELNGLVERAGKIEDRGSNCTRFFEIAREGTIPPPAEPPDTVLVICRIDGTRPGALYEVLGEFARRGVNLTRIESRPARTELGAYIFYFDLDAHCDPDMLRDAIDAVAEKSVWLKIAGAFPVHRDVTHDLGA